MNQFGFSEQEWSRLSTTEKKIIILIRQHKIEEHQLIRKWLNWPLEEPFNVKTYQSVWSRLKIKVSAFTQERIATTLRDDERSGELRPEGEERG